MLTVNSPKKFMSGCHLLGKMYNNLNMFSLEGCTNRAISGFFTVVILSLLNDTSCNYLHTYIVVILPVCRIILGISLGAKQLTVMDDS